MRLSFIPVLPALMCLCCAAVAQQAPASAATTTLSVENKLVVVPAVVRDKKGALVRGLTREAFALQVDGKAQALRYFDTDTDVPLTVGLLIDTSGSMRETLDDERSASAAFLDKMLAPERDQAFLVQFAHSVDLLQDVTTSRGKLQAALKQLDASSRPSFNRDGGSDNGAGEAGSDGQSGPPQDRRDHGRGGSSQGGTALYDAVFLASDEVLPKQKGRRALILLTDGDDRGSKVTLARAIEAAQRADVIVYAIYYKGQVFGGGRGYGGPFGGGGGPGGGGRHGGGGGFPFAGEGQGRGGSGVDGRKVLERMCGETGGRVFEVKGKQTVAAIYTEIADELRSQYRLGFTPTADAASEGYHVIGLGLADTKSKDKVQAREGYYTR